jgi:hypothetical protein
MVAALAGNIEAIDFARFYALSHRLRERGGPHMALDRVMV